MGLKDIIPEKIGAKEAEQIIDRIKLKKSIMALNAEEIVELRCLLGTCGFSTVVPTTKPGTMKKTH